MPCIFSELVNPVITYLLDQSQLSKFVQINWCGDGVPEAKKGLFHTHSGAVARYLRGTHVVVSARNEVCDLVNVSTPNSPVLV
jgi:hypothetical protein